MNPIGEIRINVYRTRLCVILILFVFISCNQASKSGAELKQGTSYYLQKVDSIRINRDNTVRLL